MDGLDVLARGGGVVYIVTEETLKTSETCVGRRGGWGRFEW